MERSASSSTENKDFDIQTYMTQGVERVIRDVLRVPFRDPKETAFLLQFSRAAKKASRHRADLEAKGEHIPPFLIASITTSCNLHCEGCYSRHNHATTDDAPRALLTRDDWSRIFRDADSLGISFILLAGGEPLLRQDVIECAVEYPNILFPIFTNGVFLNTIMPLMKNHRNLVPIMSIEGGRTSTDERRGNGIYDTLSKNMDMLQLSHILWGVSVTVTSQNLRDVTGEAFLRDLSAHGCKVVIFVEFVPVTPESRHLALTNTEQMELSRRVSVLHDEMPEIVFISFPGDEKDSDGCVAAGRGFFHINAHGGAEPCPFSPFSDTNVRETSLLDALHSPLFQQLQTKGLLKDEHVGGCTLFAREEEVKRLLKTDSVSG